MDSVDSVDSVDIKPIAIDNPDESVEKLLIQIMKDISYVFPVGTISFFEAQRNIDDTMGQLNFDMPDLTMIAALNNFLVQRRADRITCMATWALYHDYLTNQNRSLLRQASAVTAI